MSYQLPASLVTSVKKVMTMKQPVNTALLPFAFVSFKYPEHEYGNNQRTKRRMDENTLPHVDEWLKTKDNDRRAINSLNIDHTHTDDDKTHIYRYTAASRPLNKMLYAAHQENKAPDTRFPVSGNYNFTHNVPALDAAITRNKLKHELVSYSGVSWNPLNKITDFSNPKIHLPAYTSTTLDKKTALQFAKSNKKGNTQDIHILKIHHPEGSAGTYTHDDPSITHYELENEFITPRKTSLKIETTPHVFKDDDGNNVHVWTAHRMHEEESHAPIGDASEEGRSELYNKNGLKVYKTNTLSAFKTHYNQFNQQDGEAEFHKDHVSQPIYHIHTPDGSVYQSGVKYNEETGDPSTVVRSVSGRTTPIEKVAEKYPEIGHIKELFTTKVRKAGLE